MRQRYGHDYTPRANCSKHGSYPMNFMYGSVQFANACPKCDPTWQERIKAWRRQQIAEANAAREARRATTGGARDGKG